MTLNSSQAEKIKKNLLDQLVNFPEDKRDKMRAQIESMSNKELEEFLTENNLTQESECIFCSIGKGTTPSVEIGENEHYKAILELNPESKAHTIIVPKNHQETLSETIKPFTEKIVTKIKETYNPQEIRFKETKIMNHALLEIIPFYGVESKRKKATPEELQKIREEILASKENHPQETKKETVVETPKKNIPIFKPRMP